MTSSDTLPSPRLGRFAAGGGACGADEGGWAGQAAAGRAWGRRRRRPSGSRFTEQRDAAPAARQNLQTAGGEAFDGGTDVGGGFQRLAQVLDPLLQLAWGRDWVSRQEVRVSHPT